MSMPTADELNRLGADLYVRGDVEGARFHYLAALELDPGFLPAMSNMARALSHQDKLDAAVVYVRRLLSVAPASGSEWNNLGNLLMRLSRHDEAFEALEHAKRLSPDNPVTWYNFALLSHWVGKFRDALGYMDQVEALGNTSHQVENDRAHMELALGEDLGRALELYEARWWTMPHLPPWDYHIPEWKGEEIRGKSILFHAEQGLGDTIMTSRFAFDLANCGAKITLCLPPELVPLFEAQVWPDVSVMSMNDLTTDVAKRFDLQSPMYSAMRWLGIEKSDIRPSPYFTAPRITTEPVSRGTFNIGICWASGTRTRELDWRRRVAPLKHWLKLAEIPGVRLYSLQKSPEAAEIADLGAEALITDPTRSFTSFAETAAFMEKLDLVISVDTAMVHLAGALGKSCWMLSQFSHCWRWWEIALGSARPWYDSVQIIRQNSPGDWEGQLAQVHERLRTRDASLRIAA
jgi:Flp pilus assembly protein TadD